MVILQIFSTSKIKDSSQRWRPLNGSKDLPEMILLEKPFRLPNPTFVSGVSGSQIAKH